MLRAGACILVLLVAGLIPPAAVAQPDLNFESVTVNWPSIKLTFSVRCNKKLTSQFGEQHFRVVENGMPVGNFRVWCPDPAARCHISVALVLDASGSMAGAANQATITAAQQFVNDMDGVLDRAAVLWFNDRDTLVQTMTHDRPLLLAAIDSLPANGTTAVWDATYSGISEVLATTPAGDSCKAVVVLTDGIDNSSLRRVEDVALYAAANRVRVFTVGLGPSANGATLSFLAGATGGRYFSVPVVDLLAQVYSEIFQEISGIGRCEITYESRCGDGTQRTVDLHLANFCGGSDLKTRVYTAPNAGVPRTPVVISLGDATVPERGRAIIPISLVTPVTEQFMAPFQATIRFDTSCVTFDGLDRLDGCLLKDADLSFDPLPDGIILRSTKPVLLDSAGLLARLAFIARPRLRSACCDIRLETWSMDDGCLRVFPDHGEICVRADEPLVRCTISAPDSLRWDNVTKSYAPAPVRVELALMNEGMRTALEGRAWLEIDAANVAGFDPPEILQPVVPVDLRPGMSTSVAWELRPRPRQAGDTIVVCIRVEFSNHQAIRCCAVIRVPEAGPALLCSVSAEDVRVDPRSNRYVPMPFEVRALLWNAGGQKTGPIRAALRLPPGFSIAGPVAGQTEQMPIPAMLPPGQSTSVRWMVAHPPTVTPSMADIVVVTHADGDSSFCRVPVVLPPLEATELAVQCTVPDTLTIDTTGAVQPDPIPVHAVVRNLGSIALEQAQASLVLPPGVVLADPADSLTVRIPGGVLLPGGDQRTIVWKVRLVDPSVLQGSLPFGVTLSGRPSGALTDESIRSVCEIRTPSTRLPVRCVVVPADVTVEFATDGIPQPDGWIMEAVISNLDLAPVRGMRITAVVRDTSVLDIDPAGGTADRSIPVLAIGDSVRLSWRIRVRPGVLPSADLSTGVSLLAAAKGYPATSLPCGIDVLLRAPGSSAVPVCSITAPDTVRWSEEGGFAPLIAVLHAGNTGSRRLTGVRASVLHGRTYTALPPSVLDLGGIDPGTEIGTDSTLRFTLAVTGRDGDGLDTIRIVLTADGVPPVLCTRPFVLERPRRPDVRLTCRAEPDTVRTMAATVPVRIDVEIRNDGEAMARDAVLSLGGSRKLVATGPTRFPLGDVPPGSMVRRTFSFLARCERTGTDTVEVLLDARGTAPDSLLTTTCAAVVELLPCVESSLSLVCTTGDTLVVSNGVTVPSTFSVEAVIRNDGSTASPAVEVAAGLPPWARLAAGSPARQPLAPIAPGASVSIFWILEVVSPPDSSFPVCVTIGDGGTGPSCCTHVPVRRSTVEALVLRCLVPASVSAGDTIDLCAQLEAVGTARRGVVLQLDTAGTSLSILAAPAPVDVIPPNAVVACWRILLPADAPTARIPIVMHAADSAGSVRCETTLRVRGPDAAFPVCDLSTIPADTVRFDERRGVYISVHPLQPENSIRVTATFVHELSVPAHDVRATLFVPPGCTLADGENAERWLGTMAAGDSVSVTWRVTPLFRDVAGNARFSLQLISGSAVSDACDAEVHIEASPRLGRLGIPRNLVGMHGQPLSVPILLSGSATVAVNRATLLLRHDPALLRLTDVRPAGELERIGWKSDVPERVTPELTRLVFRTNGAPVQPGAERLFAAATFDVLFGAGAQMLMTTITPLEFVADTVIGGRRLRTAFNAVSESDAGDTRIEWLDGRAALSGSCIMPLVSTAADVLHQNRPNPFNPQTQVRFDIGSRGHVRIDVVDALGREVVLLVNGMLDAGVHERVFDGTRLPAGVYLLRMWTDRTHSVRRMALVK